MTMTKEERLIGISVVIDSGDWTPYEREVLGTMRQAINEELETEWIEINVQHQHMVTTMWHKVRSNLELAAHVAAVIDMYRAQQNA